MGFFRLDDILAALIMTLAMFRRLETISTKQEQNPHVRAADFEAWKKSALGGYTFVAGACALKVLMNLGWFMQFKDTNRVLQLGGLAITVSWIVAMVVAWRRLTEANARKRELGIGQKPDEQ